MASKFELAIPFVLKNEGGLVNDPKDPGGITNYGISLRFMQSVFGKSYTANSIINLTKEQACDIYKKHWWDKYRYGAIENQELATKVLDLSVNMGPKQCALLLQRACNKISGINCLAVDGILGQKTFSYINRLEANAQNKLLSELCNFAAEFYKGLAIKNPVNNRFLKGWLNRVYEK